jgi:ribosomal protein S18 acetylase RimI-like enzyme
MSSARIREASVRDALELLDLRRRVLAEGQWFIGAHDELTLTVEEQERRIVELRGSDEGTLRIARLDGALVGFVQLVAPAWRRTRHAVKLEIAVADGQRGRGIGRALMDDALAWARASPAVVKVGLVVFADNERAIGLYRSLGFREEGRREREYRMDDGTWRDDVLMYTFVDGG